MADSNYIHRTNETLLGKSDPFVQGMGLENRPVVNPALGGIGSYTHNVFEYLNVQPHIQQQAYCIVLSTPNLFSKLPAGTRLHSMCKAFFENRSLKFEGLSDRTEYEYADVTWTGHKLSFPTGATRTLGAVTHSTYDIEGEAFRFLFEAWGNWCIINSDTQMANAVTLADPGDMLLDDISVSCIYFDTTRNGRDISSAQLMVGMMPRSKVNIEMRRDKNEAGNMRNIDMEFTGLVESNTYAVKQIARSFLARMPWFNPSGQQAPSAFMNRTAILESITDTGLLETMSLQKAKIVSPTYIG